ncbi:MAG: hypothetical protein RL619_1152 [Bacteroidota bacterium]
MSPIKTKKLLIFLYCLINQLHMIAFPTFWQEVATTDIGEDSLLFQYYQRHTKLLSHKKILVVELNINVLQEKTMSILLDGRYLNVNQVSFEYVNQNVTDKTNVNEFQIWFGSLRNTENRPDFCFTVQNDKVAGKFFFNHVPYTLIPLYKNYHLLIEHQPLKLPSICASDKDNFFFEEGVKYFKSPNETQNNQDYTLRVLIALSQAALGKLREYSATYSATHFAETTLQESNLAYLRGEIPFRLKIEMVTYMSYSETEMYRDLNNLASEKTPFDQIKQLRTLYSTDIQVLVRNNEEYVAGLSTTRGLGVTHGSAFIIMSTDGMAFTPFALKHQIEHLVQNGGPMREFSSCNSHLSSLRSNFKQSYCHLGQYHAFARYANWYSEGREQELTAEKDTVIRIVAAHQNSSSIVLPHWDLNFLEKNLRNDFYNNLTLLNLHESRDDPFEGIPIKIKPNEISEHAFVEYVITANRQGVTMCISTLTGQFIQFLVDDREHASGQYVLEWDAGWLPNGVYLCTLRAGSQTRMTRIIVNH